MKAEPVRKIEIVDYKPEHQPRFKEINEQWIRRSFVMEEEDVKTLDHPDAHVLAGGGKIYMALCDDYPVGTCGYINMGDRVYEMIKMAVDENYRGLKIGLTIGEQSIQSIKALGARKIILYSNTEGSGVAINLYRRLG
ncbi:MAG: GNAT family N-acetyltransferase, partial [Bacteroidia bacterium]